MNKIIYTIMAALCCLVFNVNAQSNAIDNNSLRGNSGGQGQQPSTGITWSTLEMEGYPFEAVGNLKANPMTVFMETPYLKGEHTLKEVSFLYLGLPSKAQLLILDSDSTVIYVENILINGGTWNNVKLDKPLKLRDSKYFIGYLCRPTTERPQVIPMDGNNVCDHLGFIGVETTDRNLQIGDKPHNPESMVSLNRGVPPIVADIEGPSVEHYGVVNLVLGPDGEFIDGKPGQRVNLRVFMLNATHNQMNKVVVAVESNGEEQDFEIPVNLKFGQEAYYEGVRFLFPQKGYKEHGYIWIKSVNDVEITDGPKLFFNYTVLGENMPYKIKNALIESFSTENDEAAKEANKYIQEGITNVFDQINVKTSVINHHVGTQNDFLTLAESKELVPYLFPSKGIFTPSATINREKLDYNPSCMLKVGEDFYFKCSTVYDWHNQQGMIDHLVFTKDGIDLSGNLTSVVDTSNLYLHVVITEDNIKSKNQLGAGNDYVHNAVPRKFLFPVGGKKISVNKDLTFNVKLPAVDLSDQWDKRNLKAVAFITGKMDKEDKDFTHRSVYASNNVEYKVPESAQDIASDKPVVTVVRNHIVVTGDYDNFQVFDMAGNIVATDADAKASVKSGIYVVRVKNLYGAFTYKVEIK